MHLPLPPRRPMQRNSTKPKATEIRRKATERSATWLGGRGGSRGEGRGEDPRGYTYNVKKATKDIRRFDLCGKRWDIREPASADLREPAPADQGLGAGPPQIKGTCSRRPGLR